MKEIILQMKNCDATITHSRSGYNNLEQTMLIEVFPEKIINSPLHSSYEVLETKKENGKEIIEKNISVKSISSSNKEGFDVFINIKNLSNLELAFLLQSKEPKILFEKGNK